MTNYKIIFLEITYSAVWQSRLSLQTTIPLSSSLGITLPVTHFLSSALLLNPFYKSCFNTYTVQFWSNRSAAAIATLASCVKWPLIVRPTKMLAVLSSLCGFSIRNICYCRHFKNAANRINQQHLNDAIWNECGEECPLLLDVILRYGLLCSLKRKHTDLDSLAFVYTVVFYSP